MKNQRNRLFCAGFFVLCLLFLIFLYDKSLMIRITSSNPGMLPKEWSLRWSSADVSMPIATCSKPTSTPDQTPSTVWFFTFLLIMVPTNPSDRDSRQLVRDTWFEGYKNSRDVVLRFAIGIKNMESEKQVDLIKENGTFGDIIFVDTIENATALTNMTLALINWAHHHVNFSYFMKCYDSTYVFVKNMIAELRKRPTTTQLYYGQMLANHPIRDGDNWNLGNVYITFAAGGGYILSHDLVTILSKETPHLKWHIDEDIAIGAWVSVFNNKRRSDNQICLVLKGNNFKCKEPLLAALLTDYNRDEVRKHFNYFYEQINSDKYINITYISQVS